MQGEKEWKPEDHNEDNEEEEGTQKELIKPNWKVTWIWATPQAFYPFLSQVAFLCPVLKAMKNIIAFTL